MGQSMKTALLEKIKKKNEVVNKYHPPLHWYQVWLTDKSHT